jgi:hypothetical protein
MRVVLNAPWGEISNSLLFKEAMIGLFPARTGTKPAMEPVGGKMNAAGY